MHATEVHISSSYISGTLTDTGTIPYTLQVNSYTTLYAVEPHRNYLCAVVDHPNEQVEVVAILSNYLEDEHLLIDIHIESATHFYLLIKKRWLHRQFKVRESTIDLLIQQTVTSWGSANYSTYWRHRVFQENYQRERYKELLVQRYSLDILYRLLTDALPESSIDENAQYRNNELQKVLEIGDSIAVDFDNPIPSIKEMSQLSGVSETKFKRLFKEAFGQSPHQYVLTKRLEYANLLMKTGKYTLTQIAYKIGYNHTSGFTRLYTKKFKR